MPPRWLVIYDADCGFCRWALGVLLRADRRRRLRPLALGTGESDRALADLPVAARASSWHLIDPAGTRWSAGVALAPLVALLPGGRAPGALLERIPGELERGYGWIAAHRGWLGRHLPAAAKRKATTIIEARSRPAPGAADLFRGLGRG